MPRSFSEDSYSHRPKRSKTTKLKLNVERRPSRRASISSSGGMGRSLSQVSGGYERKVSVLDDAASSQGTNAKRQNEQLKEKLVANKGVRDMHFEIAFDARLREKSTMLESEEAKKAYKVQKVCLSRIRNVTIVVYYFIVPYFETPDWCLKYFKRDDTPPVDEFFVPCYNAMNGEVKYSDMPKLNPVICSSLDLFCLLNLCVYRMYKQKWRTLGKWDKLRNWIFVAIMLICSADVIRAAVFYQYPYVNNLCRPWVCIIFFSSIR